MLRINDANLANAQDAEAVATLLYSYARGPGGQNAPLSDDALANLAKGLREHPLAMTLLAFADDVPAGLAICVWGFSTFAGRPSVNIHDFAVLPEYQNRGIGGALLDEIESRARARGCCKITLEVHDSNLGAKRLYQRFGFGPWESKTLFVSKALP
jgi:ribosomal protein S18 acetylase RimI-like enzyme